MRYLTNIVEVDAEPMTLEEALRTGLQQGYINSNSKNTQGYKVTFHNKASLWLAAEDFNRHYLKAGSETECANAIIRIKQCALRKLRSEILSMEEDGDDDLTTIASAILSFHLLQAELRNTRRQCTAVSDDADTVGMADLGFNEALVLMDSGFAVRNTRWKQNHYFMVKHVKCYNIRYYENNPQFPINPIVTKVMTELSDRYEAETPPAYYMADANTGQYMRWDLTISETEGDCWKVFY